jgi:hypothetical protein
MPAAGPPLKGHLRLGSRSHYKSLLRPYLNLSFSTVLYRRLQYFTILCGTLLYKTTQILPQFLIPSPTSVSSLYKATVYNN